MAVEDYKHVYLPTYLPACLPACLPTYASFSVLKIIYALTCNAYTDFTHFFSHIDFIITHQISYTELTHTFDTLDLNI